MGITIKISTGRPFWLAGFQGGILFTSLIASLLNSGELLRLIILVLSVTTLPETFNKTRNTVFDVYLSLGSVWISYLPFIIPQIETTLFDCLRAGFREMNCPVRIINGMRVTP